MPAMSPSPLPSDFPEELASVAFSLRDEVAWPPTLAASAVEWFGAHGYAVLGTELWLARDGGIQSLPLDRDGRRGVYGNTVDRRVDEDWDSFALRSATETRIYLRSFDPSDIAEKGELYFSVVSVDESTFKRLERSPS